MSVRLAEWSELTPNRDKFVRRVRATTRFFDHFFLQINAQLHVFQLIPDAKPKSRFPWRFVRFFPKLEQMPPVLFCASHAVSRPRRSELTGIGPKMIRVVTRFRAPERGAGRGLQGEIPRSCFEEISIHANRELALSCCRDEAAGEPCRFDSAARQQIFRSTETF